MTLFVDTSMLFAAADRSARDGPRARTILSAGERLATTDHVIVECSFLIRRRLGLAAVRAFWEAIRGGSTLIECVTAADLELAWSIGEGFADQDFSLVDLTSFAVIQRLGLTRAASFDNDFAIVRLGPRRDRALDVVR